MRESFIFHFEYLEGIPEELQPTYAMYVINYARYGEEPALNDWRDQRMWNKTKARMNQETEKYNKKCRNLRNQPAEPTQKKLELRIVPDQEAYSNEDEANKKRFQKPTVQEVQDYCQERQNRIDAQSFVDFYESKGWKVGNQPMKDWKAAIRTWEKRTQTDRSQPQYGTQLPPDRMTL